MKSLLAAAAAALAILTTAPAALAEPVRILVTAASKVGLPAERPLKFADNDAQRVREVMVSLGGVRAENAFSLAEPSKSALFAAIDRAKAEARRHRADEVTLLFYFSGHGDREAIHLNGERVLVSDLSAKLAEVPAGLRIAVTDACRATRDKGFAADEPFAISATMIPQASGQVWLHASSDGEAAQESDELQGAIFTQAWLSGLRGAADTNGDARVTLDESFAFAHSQTLIRSSKSSGVLQKPEAVVNLREAGPVVITQTAARFATLSLPQARDTHFLVYSAAAKSVLSELWGSAERRLNLRLPPGRYVVQRRLAGSGGVAQISIAAGEERDLTEGDFSASPLGAVAAKGFEPDRIDTPPADVPHHELSLGYDSGYNARAGFVHGPRAAYSYAWSAFALTLGGAAEFTEHSVTDTKQESLTSGFGRAAFELRLPLGNVMLRAGAGGRAGVLVQTITETVDKTSHSTFVFGPEVAIGMRLSLSRTWFVDLAGTGAISFLQQEDELRSILGASGALSLGARF